MEYIQDSLGNDIYPWCMQLEIVEGCNRRCWFCGLLSLEEERKRGTNFMDLKVLEKVMLELSDWLPKIRVEINSHGEPTLHPDFLGGLRVMRRAMPKCSLNLQTNCEVWLDRLGESGGGVAFVGKMFEAGLNILVLNAYKAGLYERLLVEIPLWKEAAKAGIIPDFEWTDYYYGSEGWTFNTYWPPNRKPRIFLLRDLGAMNSEGLTGPLHKNNKRLHNSGGNSNSRVIAAKTKQKPRELPMDAKCSKVFREFILSWDGTVPVCCQDWQTEMLIGDCRTQDIRDIWYSDRYNAIRRLLYRRRRDLLSPCKGCDDPTTRVGLVADPGGSYTDEELVRIVSSTTPQTTYKQSIPVYLED